MIWALDMDIKVSLNLGLLRELIFFYVDSSEGFKYVRLDGCNNFVSFYEGGLFMELNM